MKWLYLLINFFSAIVPVLFSFHPKIQFYKHWKSFFLANALVGGVFIVWDIYFTKRGVWGFNPEYVTGIYLFHLPLEEFLFFLCIPFSCVFTYHCLNLFYTIRLGTNTEIGMTIGLSAILLCFGLAFTHKAYTSTTFISLALVLLVMKFFLKIEWLGKLMGIYPVLLIPFFIVNGILTGTGLKQPVVWYNDAENLGIRLMTIPVEDVFYGFELILLNIFFYERFKSKTSSPD